eukprot:snap_masked-scaffold_7-processed-gene-12.27-mRNA-1 protein AED:1.00 eAED:1.00 QI:0/-1/0/0/-1/1/1/0/60
MQYCNNYIAEFQDNLKLQDITEKSFLLSLSFCLSFESISRILDGALELRYWVLNNDMFKI